MHVLPIIFLVDGSASVQNAHRQSTHVLISDCVADLHGLSREFPDVSIQLLAIRFADKPEWAVEPAIYLNEFSSDLLSSSSNNGRSNFGRMLEDLGRRLERLAINRPDCLPPVLLLFSDGWFTDLPEAGYAALFSTEIGKRSFRLSVALGKSPNFGALHFFSGAANKPIAPGKNAVFLPMLRSFLIQVGMKPDDSLF